MVKDHSDSERGNPLPPHGLLFSIDSKGFLYAPSHSQDNTYHGLCYTSRGALAGTRNSSWRIDPTTHRTMSERSYHGAISRSSCYEKNSVTNENQSVCIKRSLTPVSYGLQNRVIVLLCLLVLKTITNLLDTFSKCLPVFDSKHSRVWLVIDVTF